MPSHARRPLRLAGLAVGMVLYATLLPPAAPAANPDPAADPVEREMARLSREGHGSTMALRQAYSRGRELYADEMARLLRELRGSDAPTAVRAALEESQRRWAASREAEEALDDSIYAGRHGSLAGVLILERRVNLLRCRVVRLRDLRHAVVGD